MSRISREVLVDEESDLRDLHFVIQKAFGWQDYHLHEFSLGDDYDDFDYEDYDDEDLPEDYEDNDNLGYPQDILIADLPETFYYSYDFGENWDVEITVEGAAWKAWALRWFLSGRVTRT